MNNTKRLHNRLYRLYGNRDLSEADKIQIERRLIEYFQGGYFRRFLNFLGELGGMHEPTGPVFTERGIARKLRRLGIARDNKEAVVFANEMIYTSWPATWQPDSNQRGFYFEKSSSIIPLRGLLCQLRQHHYD